MIRPGIRTTRRTPCSAPTAPALWCPGTGCRTICTFLFPGRERKQGTNFTMRTICVPLPDCPGLPGTENRQAEIRRTAREDKTAVPARSFPGKTTEKGKKPGWGRRKSMRSSPAPMEPINGTNRFQGRTAGTVIIPAEGCTGATDSPPPGLPSAGTGIFWWTATTSFLPGRSFGSWQSGTWTAPAACCRIFCATIRARRAVR